jgi:hypothetical protein
LAKGNGTHFAPAVQVEPVDDRFGRLAKGPKIPGKVGKPLIVAEQHVAMAPA